MCCESYQYCGLLLSSFTYSCIQDTNFFDTYHLLNVLWKNTFGGADPCMKQEKDSY